jgi:hypothetical protein
VGGGGGGEINEMCESKHPMPSEMRGGGWGGGKPIGDHCFSKKILSLIRLKFERKNFSNDILLIFCPTLQTGGFFVRIFQEKSDFFLPPVRFQNKITSKNSTRTFFKVHVKMKTIN